MAVPYTFGTATSSIPLSQLDSNFNTVITLGNTAIQLGNTVTTLNNMTLANVTISSGNVTLTNVTVTTANVTTANITTAVIGTETVTTSTITTANVTTANITTGNITNGTVITSLTLSYGTANGVTYLNASKVLTSGTAIQFDGTNLGIGVTPVSILHAKAASPIFTQETTANVTTGGVSYQQVKDSTGIVFVQGFAGLNNCYQFGTSIATGFMRFLTGSGTEAMRIDSSGNLLVGTTIADAKFVVSEATNAVSARIATSLSTGCTVDIFQVTALSHAAGTGFHFARFYSSGPTVQFAVRGDGTVYAQNTTIQSLSDARVKENVRNSSDGLQTIIGLRPVRFDFKKGFGNDRKNQLGFIAQEVQTVFPDAVDISGESDESGDPYKSVGPAALIPVLVKAIQEQQALITSLTARITALESN